jgi:hypothetical protein
MYEKLLGTVLKNREIKRMKRSSNTLIGEDAGVVGLHTCVSHPRFGRILYLDWSYCSG